MPTSQSVVSIEQRLSKERLSRLSRFVAVAGIAWTFFSFDYAFSGAAICSLACSVGAITSLVVYPFTKRDATARQTALAHAYLGVCFSVLVSISIMTGQSKSYASLFLCCTGIFASHMIGIRSALIWSVLSAIAVVFINAEVVGDLPTIQHHSIWDKTTHYIGVISVIFFFDYQAQHYFRVQTSELAELTDTLAEKAAALEKLAQFDPLTGLFNRHSFQRQISISMSSASGKDNRLGLLLLDLDGFKEINDTLGHQSGDAILQEVSSRIKAYVKTEYLVARLGGDEFTVIVEPVGSDVGLQAYASGLAQQIAKPYVLNGREYVLGVSIGASLYPDHAESIENLLAYADTAMYKAKASEDSVVVYESQMTEELVQRRNMENQLSAALAGNEFQVFYQPQVDVRSGRILGAEALLRWHKNGVWIPPSDFIGALESSKEIRSVGRWVLMESCQQAKKWHDMGHPIAVSVNVSSVQFQDTQIFDDILAALETSGIDPALLDLEITESMLIRNLSLTQTVLFQLRDMGVSISIDDFGTGYSSMSYLRDLPLTRLKIDRAFIMNIPQSDDGVIARTMIQLAHNLKLEVLAEGVETQDQLDFLSTNRCDAYQGYFFGRPVPANEFEARLALHSPNGSEQLHDIAKISSSL